MSMVRKEYYVDLHEGEIQEAPAEDKKQFTIDATEDEIQLLRAKMDQMSEEDFQTFWRVHRPFIPYDQDNPSDQYDAKMMEAFQMIYELGDSQTKADIEQMNVLKRE